MSSPSTEPSWRRRMGAVAIGVGGVVIAVGLAFGAGDWGNLEIVGSLALAGLVFAAVRFSVAWLRADDRERARWRYPGRHDAGGGLGPTMGQWHGKHRDNRTR